MYQPCVAKIICVILLSASVNAQVFIRSELPTQLNTPWEMTYGPDGFLWITEAGGKVSRVHPVSGNKTVVYTAGDYFPGSPSEQSPLCFQPNIGVGTLGLALHPDFTVTASPFVYFLYSYNSGTTQVPVTRFKVVRLTWKASAATVVADTTIIPLLPTGYDHLGGRLMAIKRNGTSYLFLTCGDNGVSETNAPDCYTTQTNNPNNFAQNPNYKNGKIHRFNMDGSIAAGNPKAGNSMYTRGHRNPQGLMYNYNQDVLYDVEHGDRTDDEINILEAGKNYAWKNMRGYHSDNNFPGEIAFINNYIPDPSISNDGLKEAFYAWCAVPQPTSGNGSDWCTVAPSDGIYYGSGGVPEWTNSLLVVTLKDGNSTDQEVYQFKLTANGLGLFPSSPANPNPKRFFGSDQALNGRLRDIAISPDGTKIFLINNGGANADKITVYTYDAFAGLYNHSNIKIDALLYPNPGKDELNISAEEKTEHIDFIDMLGQTVKTVYGDHRKIMISDLQAGTYLLVIQSHSGKKTINRFIKNPE